MNIIMKPVNQTLSTDSTAPRILRSGKRVPYYVQKQHDVSLRSNKCTGLKKSYIYIILLMGIASMVSFSSIIFSYNNYPLQNLMKIDDTDILALYSNRVRNFLSKGCNGTTVNNYGSKCERFVSALDIAMHTGYTTMICESLEECDYKSVLSDNRYKHTVSTQEAATIGYLRYIESCPRTFEINTYAC